MLKYVGSNPTAMTKITGQDDWDLIVDSKIHNILIEKLG